MGMVISSAASSAPRLVEVRGDEDVVQARPLQVEIKPHSGTTWFNRSRLLPGDSPTVISRISSQQARVPACP